MHNPVDFLLEFLRTFDEGQAFLPAGTHVHKIKTKGRPVAVWIGEVSQDGVPVCGGGINLYGTTLVSDGFILYAEVVSDSVDIEWQATLEAANSELTL